MIIVERVFSVCVCKYCAIEFVFVSIKEISASKKSRLYVICLHLCLYNEDIICGHI